MSWQAGTVEIADDEGVSGSGQALALYNAIKTEEESENPLPSLTPPPNWPKTAKAWEQEIKKIRLKILRGYARRARAIASIATYATTNAVVTVTIETTDSGIQRDPATSDPCLGPSTQKQISGSIG